MLCAFFHSNLQKISLSFQGRYIFLWIGPAAIRNAGNKKEQEIMKPVRSAADGLISYLIIILVSSSIPFLSVETAQTQTEKTETIAVDTPETDLPDLEEVENLIEQVEASTTLSSEQKEQITQICNQTVEKLKTLGDWKKSLRELENQIQKAQDKQESLREELSLAVEYKTPTLQEAYTLSQLEELYANAEMALAGIRKEYDEVVQEIQKISERRKSIPEALTAAKTRLADITSELEQSNASDEIAEMKTARQYLLLTRKSIAETEIKFYELALQTRDIRNDWLMMRRDLASRHLNQAEKQALFYRDAVNQSRREEAEKAAAKAFEAQKEAVSLHPRVHEIAVQNAAYAEERTGPNGIAAKIESTLESIESVQKTVARLKEEFNSVKKRVDVAGVTTSLGFYLVHKRAGLPNTRRHLRNIRERQNDIVNVQLRLMELEEERAELADLNAQAEEIMMELRIQDQETADQIKEWVLEHLRDKKNYLDALIRDYNSYFSNLIDLDSLENQLISEAENYKNFIDENILWVRSTKPLNAKDIRRAWEALRWLFNPDPWAYCLKRLFAPDFFKFSLYLVMLFALLVWIRFQPVLNKTLTNTGQNPGDSDIIPFKNTLFALFLTLMIALTWPLLLLISGLLLSIPLNCPDSVKAVSTGIIQTSLIFFFLQALRQFLRPGGIAERHFNWNSEIIKTLRQNLRIFTTILLPLSILLLSMSAQFNENFESSLGRLTYLAVMLLMSIFSYRLFHPAGVIGSFLLKNEDSWLYRLRYIIFLLIFTPPVFLIIAAVLGYYYTSQDLATRLAFNYSFLVLALPAYCFGLRWYEIHFKKISRRPDVSMLKTGEPKKRPEPDGITVKDSNALDIDKSRTHTHRFLNILIIGSILLVSGLIWSDVLPALGMLNRVHLWSYTAEVAEKITGTDGASSIQTVEEQAYVTLADIFISILIIVLTFAASRHLPLAMDSLLLIQLPFDSGSRYAIRTVTKYLLVLCGFIIILRYIGISWTSVSMVAAAVTVGLGFGLQEIFANFISGLIILFEQPIRVSDVITIGDITGEVTKIQIRATTIRTWEKKELVVPNKEFITGKLVNWTLSDSTLRLEFNVGIAYGSDVQKACDVLLRIVRHNFRVLSNPEPYVVFESFGDNALQLSLRAFIDFSLGDLLKTRHEINSAIDSSFKKEGIEIAFPQRDIHIRTVKDGIKPFRIEMNEKNERKDDYES